MSNKTFEKWRTVLKAKADGSPWEEKEIIYFRKAISLSSKMDSDLKDTLFYDFDDFMPRGGYSITLEQQQKGTEYLLSNSLKKNGTSRSNNKLNRICIRILKDKPIHRLVELKSTLNKGYFLPVYKAIGFSDGLSFIYTGTTYKQMNILHVDEIDGDEYYV